MPKQWSNTRTKRPCSKRNTYKGGGREGSWPQPLQLRPFWAERERGRSGRQKVLTDPTAPSWTKSWYQARGQHTMRNTGSAEARGERHRVHKGGGRDTPVPVPFPKDLTLPQKEKWGREAGNTKRLTKQEQKSRVERREVFQ